MKVSHSLMVLLAVTLSSELFAEKTAIGDNGRQVQLNDDGSWRYSSTDRFATTADGKRVRLKDDGSWEYTGGKAVIAEKVVSDQTFVDDKSVELILSDMVIESVSDSSQKITRRNTQTVFYVSVKRDSQAANAEPLTLSASDLSVEDSDGRQYPIVSLAPASITIKPGDELSMEVRAEGSPLWWTTKTMSLLVDKNALGAARDVNLTRRLSSAKKLRVNRFN